MKRLSFTTIALLLVLLVVGGSWSAVAGSSSPLEISWFTIDGGGTMSSSSGPFALGGTIGQPDAGSSGNGAYTLHGGFWFVAQANTYQVYLPAALR